MAKKQAKAEEKKAEETQPKIPPELEQKLKAIKAKLDTFKKQVLDKFGDYIIGITLLPPENIPPDASEQTNPEKPKAEKPNPDRIDLLLVCLMIRE